MEDSGVKNWIESRLDQGRNPEQVKEVLKKKGYNPSLVEEVNKEKEETGIDKEKFRKKKEKTETITGKLEKQIKKDWKPGLAIILILALLATGIVLAGPITQKLNNVENPVQQTQKTGETQGYNTEANTTVVRLSNGVAKPPRPSINPGENIEFQNKAVYDMEIVFESGKEKLEIPAGESRKTSFNSLTYYTAKPLENEGEEISGSVIAQ